MAKKVAAETLATGRRRSWYLTNRNLRNVDCIFRSFLDFFMMYRSAFTHQKNSLLNDYGN